MRLINALLNNATAFYHYKRGDVILKNLPTLLWIEPTNNCNFKCIMCPNQFIQEDNKGFMKWDVYTTIIDEAKDFALSAYLFLSGESMLHPEIFKMIEYAQKNGISAMINTNASTLNHENCIKLLNSGLDSLVFSVDGYNKETYESIRINGNFEKVVDNIVNFLKLKKELKKNKPHTVLITINTGVEKYNNEAEEREKFINIFKGLPLNEFLIKEPSNWGGYFADTTAYRPQKLSNIYSPCSLLWSTMCVLWDGTVAPCCLDVEGEYKLGNVLKKSLRQIWNDAPMVTLRKKMTDRTYLEIKKGCYKCPTLWLPPVLGIPSGMRLAIGKTLDNIFGYRIEKYMIKIAKRTEKSFPMRTK